MANLTTDLDMCDLVARMYNKLGEEGYRGDCVDKTLDELEKQMTPTHKAVLNKQAHPEHFKRLCVDFYRHYQGAAPLRDEGAEWLRKMEEAEKCQ